MVSLFGIGDPLTLATLAVAAFLAGMMDSIAGGGGLITVPALLSVGLPPALALGTNKLQASFGSGTALARYARKGLVPREDLVPSVFFTATGAVVGVLTVRFLPTVWLGWLIPLILVVILVYLLVKPSWGLESRSAKWKKTPFYVVFGLALGFYDGFLGPGTGTFWTVALTGILGYGLVQATAQTKVANFTSNLVALVVFGFLGQVLWGLGLLMGISQGAGAWTGTKLAMSRGAGFIRWVFLGVVALTLVKLLWTALT